MSARRALSGALLGALGFASLALTAAGCGDRTGSNVSVGSPAANLRVINTSSADLVVFVDGVDLGTVRRGDLEDYDIRSGVRDVDLRQVDENFVRFQGAFDFQDAGSPGFQRVDIEYNPGVTRNFWVRNDDFDDIFVLVDGQEIGIVRAFEASDFQVTGGIHDVEFREDSSNTLIQAGTYDFSNPGSGGPEVELIYDP